MDPKDKQQGQKPFDQQKHDQGHKPGEQQKRHDQGQQPQGQQKQNEPWKKQQQPNQPTTGTTDKDVDERKRA